LMSTSITKAENQPIHQPFTRATCNFELFFRSKWLGLYLSTIFQLSPLSCSVNYARISAPSGLKNQSFLYQNVFLERYL
jgi:hypothetical protein